MNIRKFYICTVKSQAVDRSTIQFWILWPKVTVHKDQTSLSSAFRKCATNQDRLLLATLRYIYAMKQKSVSTYFRCTNCLIIPNS